MGRPGSGSGGTGGGFRPTPPSGQNRAGTPPRVNPPSGRQSGGKPPSGKPPVGMPPGGRSPGGKPPVGRSPIGGTPGGRPPMGPRPPMPPRGGRYNPPPRSPKRPRSYGRNSGCGNIIIGGFVILIIVFIVLMNILRSSCVGCTGCVKGTESDVDSSGTTQSSDSSAPPSVPDSSSSMSTEPPKPPVVPVMTLVKNEPSKPFNDECVIDELKWFDDAKTAGANLKFVYDKLGIQPYIVFKKYDPALKTNEDKVRHCVDWYKANIMDEDTFLLMYFAEKSSNTAVGYTVYYSGANAEKLAIDFKGILEDGINEYWFTDLSTDDVIKYAFEYTCDRITVKTADEMLQPETSKPTSESSESTTEETTEETTGETGE